MLTLTEESLYAILEEEEFNCTIEEPGDGIPFPRVCVFLGRDYQNRDRILEIRVKDQLMTRPEGKEEASHLVLEYFFRFPFQHTDFATADTARFIAFINRASDLPGLEMDEIDNTLFYRYVLVSNKQEIDPKHLVALVGMIQIYLDLFTENFEQIATGRLSVNDLIDESLTRVYG